MGCKPGQTEVELRFKELERKLVDCDCKSEAFDILMELNGLYQDMISAMRPYLSGKQMREVEYRFQSDVEF